MFAANGNFIGIIWEIQNNRKETKLQLLRKERLGEEI